MKSFSGVVLAFFVGTAVSASPIDLSLDYSSYIAFGDSLTDDGKFEGTPFEPGLPSLGGRFSNGLTYAEIVAQDFTVSGKFSANFAIGGATARLENENALPPQFGTFSGQVATFSGVILDPIARAAVGARPLFSVLFGGNDVLQNVGLPSDFDFLPGVGALAAEAVAANIRAISNLSSTFTDFALINLPDISQTPLFQNPAFGAGALAPLAAVETNGFNMRLAELSEVLRSEGLNIIDVDLKSFNEQATLDALTDGVDVVTPCSFDLSNPGPEGTCVFSPGSPDDTDLSLADNFFYIDGVHPNRQVQAGFAGEFEEAVAAANVSPVPLPAGLPLLLAGLGALAFVRRRAVA